MNMPDLSRTSSPEVPDPAQQPSDTAGTGTGTDPDTDAVNALRSGVMRLSRRLKHQRVDESLSPAEMSVLGTLARCGSATPGELARKEHVQPPSMTRIVALLESKDLVRLEPHPEDRRQKVVTQTERAEAMLEESRRKRNAWLAELAGRLDEDEWATLRAAAPVLEKLAHL
ncbi:MarR family transcriptional regulator [Streptomyces mobaraensis NBRC 13819 = DSM 40847]|nr:MarR family transcriptional regulator [Streptomyces mobaraensis NBRC 13819 = DSM 40847]